MEMFERQIKGEDGKLDYDRVDDIIQKYHVPSDTVEGSLEDKHMRQFSSRAIQISKNLYLKVSSIDYSLSRRKHLSEEILILH